MLSDVTARGAGVPAAPDGARGEETVLRAPSAGADIWYISLAGDAREAARHEAVLSAGEKKRAGEFRFEGDALRYVIAHGALRDILARYAGRDARQIAFSAGSAGKPALVAPRGSRRVGFNLAHSGNVALVAVSEWSGVGIDIEEITESLDLPSIARRCFSPAELGRLESVPPREYAGHFYTFWTRKEAYVKGRGDGLAAPLTEIDVSASPARPGGGWIVRDIPVPPAYRGAVAARGGAESYRTFRYEDLPR